MFDSKEKFADWLTLGTVEMAKGAFNPDEAWSADHWLNSLGMVTLLYGPVEKSLLPTGSGGLKPPKGLDSVKDFEVKKPLPAFSTNEGFQFKINNLDIDTPALPKTPMQINFKNEMDRILREKMEGKSESNHSIKDVEVKAVEGTGNVEIPYGTQIDKVGNKKILKPNAKYTTPEGYTYETNEFGRIDSVEADLQLGKGTRNKYAQSNVGETDRIRGDYPERDDGGHLIGSQFNGSGDIDNLVPMNSQINEAGGQWHQMEQEWAAALERGESAKVKIKPQYTGDSARPDSFIVEYSIDGGRTQKVKINNQNGG